MVRVKAMSPAKAAREYWAWSDEAREWYDERLSILSDGGKVTPEIDWAARLDARRVHCATVSQNASQSEGLCFPYATASAAS